MEFIHRELKIMAAVIVFFICLSVGKDMVCRAASSDEGRFCFQCYVGEQYRGTDNFEMALRWCKDSMQDSNSKAGVIVMKQSRKITETAEPGVCVLPKGVSLVIPSGVHAQIGYWDIILEGELSVYGELILGPRRGVLIDGGGELRIREGGRCIKGEYEVKKEEDVCFRAGDIFLGQSLAEAVIDPESVLWQTSVPGVWSFVEPDFVPDVGTAEYEIRFTPENTLSYDAKTFESAGQVTVKPTPTPVPASAGLSLEGESGEAAANSGGEDREMEGGDGIAREESVVIRQMPAVLSSLKTFSTKAFQKNRPRINKVRRQGKKAEIAWKRISGATGYQICYSTQKNMKKKKIQAVKKTKKVLKGLKRKKSYYVRIRAYRGKKKRTYTKWSSLYKITPNY